MPTRFAITACFVSATGSPSGCLRLGVHLINQRPVPLLNPPSPHLESMRHRYIPIAVLIWLMIYPMMLKVDFTALGGIARKPKGLAVTLFVNWLVKPFSMAFLGWLFMQHIFARWISPELAKEY